MRGSRRVRLVVLPAVMLAGAAVLSGCTSSPVGAVVSAAPTAPSSSAPAPDPTPTTPPPTQVAADATPVSVRCGKLVPKAVVQQLVPQLTREQDWTPEAGSPAARLADLNGTVCAWTDSAGDRVEVAVAKPSRSDAVALKNDLVRRSNSVPTYGGEAYFQVVDHIGQVDAFRGRTWILARSNRFFEPGDAIEVLASIDEALGFERAPSATPSAAATPGASGSAAMTPAPSPTVTP